MGVGSRRQTAEDRTRWADTQWAEAVICWTCENGKMRHMAVEFGLMDGWMDMFYVPYWAPKAPPSSWVGWAVK